MLDAAVGAFRVYGSYACGDPDALLDVVRYRLQLKRALKESAGLSTEDAAALRAFERSEVQKAVTTELLDELGSDTQAAEAERLGHGLLSLAPGAYVVFTTSQRTALAVGDHLAAAECNRIHVHPARRRGRPANRSDRLRRRPRTAVPGRRCQRRGGAQLTGGPRFASRSALERIADRATDRPSSDDTARDQRCGASSSPPDPRTGMRGFG